MTRRIIAIAVPILLLSVLMVQVGSAAFFRNTFQPDAYLDTHGRHVWVTAQIACTAGERLSVQVTLTQESTLAVGHGRAETFCAPVDLDDPNAFQYIPVRVTAQGRNSFGPGHAIATGFATTRDRGQITDVRQWQPAAGITIH